MMYQIRWLNTFHYAIPKTMSLYEVKNILKLYTEYLKENKG